jgi:glycosyltransferase involved in cell wall biosynthesis
MRVLLAPFFEGNQYLELLVSHLEARDVDVHRSTSARPLALPLVDLLRTRPDVFHLHWLHPYFLFGSYEQFYRIPFVKYLCWVFALLFVAQVRIGSHLCDRLVWTAHNKCNHERRYQSMDRWVSSRVAAEADTVQVWDEHTRDELVRYLDGSPEKVVAIPHGNYLTRYPPETRPTRDEARSQLDLPQNTRVFLYFGRIRPYKQVLELLDTWCEIEPSNAHLLIAGSSSYPKISATLRREAATRSDVTLDLRYVPDTEVPTYFAACDLAVFPYEHIFSSGSVVLAMSMGRPFVAPEKGAIPSLDPGGNVVYPDGELRSGLEEGISLDADVLDAVGDRNATVATEDLDWDDVTDRIVALYRG